MGEFDSARQLARPGSVVRSTIKNTASKGFEPLEIGGVGAPPNGVADFRLDFSPIARLRRRVGFAVAAAGLFVGMNAISGNEIVNFDADCVSSLPQTSFQTRRKMKHVRVFSFHTQ